MDDEEAEGAEDWTLADLEDTSIDNGLVPSAETCLRLARDFRARVCTTTERTSPADVFGNACNVLGLDPSTFNMEVMKARVQTKQFAVRRLCLMLEHHRLRSTDAFENVKDVLRAIATAERYMVQVCRLMFHTTKTQNDQQDVRSRLMLSLEPHYTAGEQTVLEYDAEKLDSFQRLFLQLREYLETCCFRRADGQFFKRVKTPLGVDTLAFAPEITISEWVGTLCNYYNDFEAWLLSTRPATTFMNVVKHLTDRPLTEAPDLEENRHLRSFAGDVLGVGAGVYDCDSDMFFPYGASNEWPDLAEDVERVRRALGFRDYRCAPPDAHDTALIHLPCAFPYDIHAEVQELEQRERVYYVWRETYEFECRALQHELAQSGDLARHLARALPELTSCHDESRPPLAPPDLRFSGEWCLVRRDTIEPPREYTRITGVDSAELREAVDGVAHGERVAFDPRVRVPSPQSYLAVPGTGGGTSTGPEPRDGFLVPLFVAQSQPRVSLTASQWERLVHEDDAPKACAFSFVRDTRGGRTRFFRVCLGSAWSDCEAAELDQIYVTQLFTDYDRFQCYANKGRQFFEVGEKDSHQYAHVLEGVGGCGKSTDMNCQMAFFPPHRCGIFAGNLEPLFGLSAACKEGEALGLFCSEMSSTMACKQEEFNQIVSGDTVSAARKNKHPWTGIVRAQLFLVGNKKPLNYSDTEGQFSRRIMGIYMSNLVRPRDSRVAARLKSKLGQVCRKNVLAYDEFRRMWGSTDPMSRTDLLPPGFAAYYERAKRETNPFQAFLSDGGEGCVRAAPGKFVLLQTVRELYAKYRQDNGLSKSTWRESTYWTVFAELGVKIVKKKDPTVDGEMHPGEHDVAEGLERVPVA